MARIEFLNGLQPITESSKIQKFLQERGVEYRFWAVSSDLNNLLDKDVLDDSEKESLLEGLDSRFQELKEKHGYTTRDLIVLHPQVVGLPDMLAKFDKLHFHTDDEVRYIIDGSGIFGFNINGEEFSVYVEKNDFISVPKNTNHWFKLDGKMRIKAVRYFQDMSGWVPHYVE
jgi:1,2-dihydroxy-3-keto-5-methylthiopentene dioxygenase